MMRLRSTASSTGSFAGLLIFGIIWTLFSSAFLFLGAGGMLKGARGGAWTKVPCVIDTFEIHDNPKDENPFTVVVEYRYQYEGAERIGTNWTQADKHYDSYAKLAEKRVSWLADRNPVCRFNPANPGESFLSMDGSNLVGGAVFGIFGGCFVLIGIGLIVVAFRSRVAGHKGTNNQSSITAKAASPDASRWLMIPFFSVFALAGLGLLFGLFLPAWLSWLSTRSWVEVPAEVIWSKVSSHKGDKNTTYSVDVFYKYDFDGREYRSDASGFFQGNSGNRQDKKNWVDAHPQGTSIEVWVDPARPHKAVRDRSLSAWAWFTLFPLPFIAVGLGGLIYTFKSTSGRSTGRAVTAGSNLVSKGPAGANPESNLAAGQSLVLQPGKGRLLRVAGLLFAAAFWNGIVSVFLVQVVKGWQNAESPWFLTLFLVPFVLIGLGLITGFLHQLGALFNPRPSVKIDPGTIRLGQSLSLVWEIPRNASRLRNLTIALRGEEVATYRRGTNTATDRATFFHQEIARAEVEQMIANGRGHLNLPRDLMPTWKAANNQIVWTVSVRGEIPFWPDINDTHEVIVHYH